MTIADRRHIVEHAIQKPIDLGSLIALTCNERLDIVANVEKPSDLLFHVAKHFIELRDRDRDACVVENIEFLPTV